MLKTIVIATVGLAFALTPATLCMAFWPKSSERLVLMPVSVGSCSLSNPERFVRVEGNGA